MKKTSAFYAVYLDWRTVVGNFWTECNLAVSCAGQFGNCDVSLELKFLEFKVNALSLNSISLSKHAFLLINSKQNFIFS